MKKILILLAFFSPLAINAYYGDVQNFIIEGNSICLNAPEVASRSYISEVSSVSKNATWQAEITLSFSPTSSNYLRWFIMADSAKVNSSSSGYYLMFGGTKRTISFYCLKQGKSVLVHQENEKLLNNSSNRIKVSIKRLESNDWVLEYTLNDTLSNVSQFYNDEVNFSSYLGWHCVYTKTRSKSFCFAKKNVSGEELSAPRIPKIGEVLINEVLFNPIGDGVDFIEIYNASDTIFDLSTCLLGNKKQTYSIPYYILPPDSCVAITSDSAILCSQYNCVLPTNIIQVEKMLPLPNDSGCICLWADTVLVDSFSYKADMHHALLDNVEGLSLERSEDDSWHSASTLVKATPGYKNSRKIDEKQDDSIIEEDEGDKIAEEIKLLTSVVHLYDNNMPENVELLYRLHSEYRLSVKVFSLGGYAIYTILDNELISGEGKLHWDGRGENSEVLPVGIYVIVVEFYSADGEYKVSKMPVAIIP